MPKAKLTSKGQVTIPKQVRDDLALAPGDRIEFAHDRRGGYSVRPIRTAPSAQGICDRLIKPGKHATTENMRSVVAESASRRFSQAVGRVGRK